MFVMHAVFHVCTACSIRFPTGSTTEHAEHKKTCSGRVTRCFCCSAGCLLSSGKISEHWKKSVFPEIFDHFGKTLYFTCSWLFGGNPNFRRNSLIFSRRPRNAFRNPPWARFVCSAQNDLSPPYSLTCLWLSGGNITF